MSKIIAQMYSLRKAFEKDFDATLKRVKEIGFDGVQLDGMRGNSVEDVAKAIKKYEIKVYSMHIKHDRFINDVDGIIEECRLFDCDEVYCKYIEDEFQNEPGYRFTKYALDKAFTKLKEANIYLGLHSPEYDFKNLVDNQYVMDYICEEKDGIAICPEPDTYWLSVSEINPCEYITKYPNRIRTIHCKDIDTSKDLMDMGANIRECGNGDVDFKSVIRWGIKNGVQCFAVEQDQSSKDMFDSMQESYNYMRNLYNEVENEG